MSFSQNMASYIGMKEDTIENIGLKLMLLEEAIDSEQDLQKKKYLKKKEEYLRKKEEEYLRKKEEKKEEYLRKKETDVRKMELLRLQIKRSSLNDGKFYV
jgi:uncharacterized protein with gpF-like domain